MSCWQNSRATGTLRNGWQAGKLTWSLWKCLSMSTKAENVRSLNTRETFTAPRLQIFIIHAKVKSLSHTLSQLCSETFPTVVLWVLLHKIWHSKNESYTQCKQWARPKTTNLQDVNVYKLERWHRLECGKILILSPGQNNVWWWCLVERSMSLTKTQGWMKFKNRTRVRTKTFPDLD